MTPARLEEIRKLPGRLRNCPPPHRVDFHEAAAWAIEELLAEVDGQRRQVTLWSRKEGEK